MSEATVDAYSEVPEHRSRANGEHLVPVGGRMVAEVLVGPDSYWGAEPGWRLTLPSAGAA